MRPARTAVIALAGALVWVGGLAGPAHADDPGTGAAHARAVAHAGAVVVSEDGGAALLLNPGGLVRRDQVRVQLGVSVHDGDATFRALPGQDGAPDGGVQGGDIVDRGPPTSAPYIAAQAGVGRFVLAAVLIETADAARVLPEPERNLDPANQQRRDQIRQLFAHRYGGTSLAFRRRVLAAGGAARVGEWLGVGASVTLSQTHLAERRFVWAGFDGIDDVGDPVRDLVLDLAGDSRATLGAVAGALIAPPELPVEVAVSATVRAGDALSGDAGLDRVTTDAFPNPRVDAPRGDVRLPTLLAVRAGVRYLGRRVLGELGGEVTMYTGTEQPMWSITGIEVEDGSGRTDPLVRVPSMLDYRPHAAVRGAVDVEVVPGFLWLSAGYAYRTRGSRPERWLPGHADLGGHTLAAGAEGQWSGTTLTIGYARTMAAAVTVPAGDQRIVNPFDAGTAAIGADTYSQGHDAFGVSVEMAWE